MKLGGMVVPARAWSVVISDQSGIIAALVAPQNSRRSVGGRAWPSYFSLSSSSHWCLPASKAVP